MFLLAAAAELNLPACYECMYVSSGFEGSAARSVHCKHVQYTVDAHSTSTAASQLDIFCAWGRQSYSL